MRQLRLLRRAPGSRDQLSSATGLEHLGVPPEGGDIYDLALTHRSFAYEQAEPIEHNERLEFLGDAILGAIVTDLIFTTYPELSEGEMARLRASAVNTQALAEVAEEVGLGEHIKLGKGEEGSGGRSKPSLLADTFEAVVGAIYVDRGIDAITDALLPLFGERLRATLDAGDRYDAKTALQETVVRERGGFPEYRVTSTGPDHDKNFVAEVYVGNEIYGSGSGKSKKEAEHYAARAALQRFDVTEMDHSAGSDDQSDSDESDTGDSQAGQVPSNDTPDPVPDQKKERPDARAS